MTSKSYFNPFPHIGNVRCRLFGLFLERNTAHNKLEYRAFIVVYLYKQVVEVDFGQTADLLWPMRAQCTLSVLHDQLGEICLVFKIYESDFIYSKTYFIRQISCEKCCWISIFLNSNVDIIEI